MRELPMLEKTYDLISVVSNLDSVAIITCHHIIECDYILMNYLERIGFCLSNLYVIGKNYSTNKETYKKYKEKGIYVDKNSLSLNVKKSFDEEFRENVVNFLQFADFELKIKENIKKVIIYDEGGFLLEEVMTNSSYHFLNKHVIGIEHTSSGYNKIKKLKFKFPIINVAKSYAKLKYVSPFIAKDNVQKIIKHLEKLNINVDNVLIIGGGEIGKSMKESLSKHYSKIDIFDKCKIKSEFNTRDLRSILNRYDLIIGAMEVKV